MKQERQSRRSFDASTARAQINASSFLAGAKSRLLPPSIPFRFFAAAAVFHVLMWIVLLIGAGNATSFAGGLGPILAALHLLTLGVLVTTAIGAAAQLLPVATRRPLAAVWPIKLVFWLAIPGMAALIIGMYTESIAFMIAGAAAAGGGLLLFAIVLTDNLRRAGSLAVVAAHGFVALAALVGLVGLGVALASDYRFAVLPDHAAAALAHLILGGFGFMGFLALGFSHVLVPMFALGAAPQPRSAFAAFGAATASLALGTFGALADSRIVLTAAALTGLCAAAMHLWQMQRVLEGGMRKRLGLSFVLVRAAWTMLPLTLLAGLAALYGAAGANGATLFGLLLVGGWLLTFLLGILQRILPFLASMHAGGGAPPRLSALASASPLKLHAVCHGVALAALALAVVMDNLLLLRAASFIGLVGAIAFAWFTAGIIRHILTPAWQVGWLERS